MMHIDIYTDSESAEKVYEIHHVWLYSCELYGCLGGAECCHHEDIFCCCYCKVCSEGDTFIVISSLKGDIFPFAHIFISIREECSQMFIDRAFSDIASTRIWYLECTESCEECRKEKYTNTYLADLISVEVFYREFAIIHSDSTLIPCYSSTERLDDREERENITNLRNIMECKVVKK